MTELTTTGNALSKLMLQSLVPSLKGAHIGIIFQISMHLDC